MVKRASKWSSGSRTTIGSKLKNLLKPKPPLKARLTEIIYKLEVQEEKLKETINRLKKREQELFHRTISEYLAKDFARAAIYASEVAELRKIIKVVYASSLALERVKIRLETVRDLGDVAVIFAPLVPVLKELKNQLSGIIPEIAIGLDEVSNTMNNMLLEFGEASSTVVTVNLMSEDAKKVLSEAQAIAEERLKEEFPQLPSDIPSEIPLVGSKKIAIPLPASGKREITTPTRTVPLQEVEKKILEHVKAHNGLLDINLFSKETGIPRESAMKAINSLMKKGKIKAVT